MRLKVFLTVFIGSAVMLIISSALVITQLRGVQALSLDPLSDALYTEDAKILSWIISAIPADRLENMKLPESWAEIFVLSTADLILTASTNPARKGTALHSHPSLLDQASPVIQAVQAHKGSTITTRDYMVVVVPLGSDRSIIALKPKAWEKGLLSQFENQLKEKTSGITLLLGIFVVVGIAIALMIAFIITRLVVAPTRRAFDALEALSLGDFDRELPAPAVKEMEVFTESYLRLKTSLEMALERMARR